MPKKLSQEHLEKLKKGRKEKNEMTGLVCAFGEKIQVWADTRQFILRIKGRPDSFYPTLEILLSQLLDLKIREISTQQIRKDLTGLEESLQETKKWFESEIILPLTQTKNGPN